MGRGAIFFLALAVCLAISAQTAPTQAADGNRLAYLSESDPFYPSRAFARLTAPQWVGEPGVEAVVILAIDDMKGHEKWEAFLRPLLTRLEKIDGRAHVSIMTCQIDPRHPHLQTWLAEGVSLETHTYDHPCPLLQKGDLAKAKATYDRCVEMMAAVPHSRPVAFRMPCCDSQNTPSPRFYAEIFNRRTPAGHFLEIDSSVFNVTTPNDPALPRQLVLDEQSRDVFHRYLPFKSYAVTIEDYPYPYVIGKLCWEFPCVVPSDWSAQHVNKPNNPGTVFDLKRAIDAAVVKQGVFTLVFHPHKWIKSEQLIELVDHTVAKHGRKVKFLNFREAHERLLSHLTAGQSLRTAEGGDNGVRLVDLNADGHTDVVIANAQMRRTRLWSPADRKWIDGDFPLLTLDGAQFGVVHADGFASLIARDDKSAEAWRFDGQKWQAEPGLLAGLELDGKPVLTTSGGVDQGLRLRDVNGDGRCELIVANPNQSGVFGFDGSRWVQWPQPLPSGMHFVDAQGRDAGLRLVDIDQDGSLDLLQSNEAGYAAHVFTPGKQGAPGGWSQQLVSGKPGDAAAIPMITRDGTNNGAWIHGRTLWVQNENTDQLPDLVDRLPLDNLLTSIPFPGPKSPRQSLAVTHARPGFQVELMAAEPLVTDPVSIAFGPDGKLWVAEMGDYPQGADNKGKKGGVIRFLEDTDADGRYDKSTVFLDDLGFPNGVTPWRRGVIVSCAPEVIYAEDTDGDGRADKREVLYFGFAVGNPQHRMNGFRWGMDGWLYGAHADSLTGRIKLVKRDEFVSANHRDFRIKPDQGLLDPQVGVSQYGRNSDDWGNWFGNTNSDPLYQYVLDDRYLRRNPHVTAIHSKVDVPEQAGAAEVFPRSRTTARFNDLYAANRFTSANSSMIYRDDLFGPAFEGNAFISEPVHNLVHREVLRAEGLLFVGRRADDEHESEFLASADNWFRPTSLVTGPDGALWVADMYRQTIEHPEWIPPGVQKQLDLRAGADQGRIYRVYPIGVQPRPIRRLDTLTTAELAAALDSPSGWQRDMAQQLLVWRADPAAVAPLRALVDKSQRPTCRAQALWTLELLGSSDATQLVQAMHDPHPGVRRHAVQIAEAHLAETPRLGEAILKLSDDSDPHVQLQRAYTLGEWKDPRAGGALGELALRFADDRFLTAATLSSINAANLSGVMERVLSVESGEPLREPPPQLIEALVGLATAYDDKQTLSAALARIGAARDGKYADWQLTALAGLLAALDRREKSWETYDPDKALARMFDFARRATGDAQASDEQRLLAVRLLGRDPARRADDVRSLVALLVPGTIVVQPSAALQAAALEALSGIDDAQVSQSLLAGWKGFAPELRSPVLDCLLGRPQWAMALLAAIDNKQVPAAEIDASRRQRLMALDDPHAKELARRLWAGSVESDRQQVLERHAAVLEMTGDAQAGAAVFNKRCASCHRLRGVGHEVGPNLASLTDYSPQALLTALLDPNKAVEAKYADYLALTTSGLTYTGLLASESGNSVTLRGQEGKEQTILRTELETLKATGKSLMPDGLEKDLAPADLANVIAYLRASGAPRKRFPANHPRVVTPSTDGTLQLYATSGEIYGQTLVMEHLYKNLSRWQSETDRVVWSIEVPKAGRYAMWLNYACLDQNAGNQWVLEAGDKQLTGKVASTGSIDNYQQIRAGEIDLPAGPQQIILRPSAPIHGSLLHFGGIQLKPVK